MSKSRIISFDRYHPPDALVRRVMRHLSVGGLVVLPTETQYALSADALSTAAVSSVRQAKGRTEKRPLSAFFPDRESLDDHGIIVPDYAEKLTSDFWPGPVTLILPARNSALNHLGSVRTVGVRVTPEPLLTALGRRYRRPLVATSANPSGAVLTPAAENRWLARQANDGILLWVRPIRYHRRIPSTVVDCTGKRPRILRAGAVSVDRIQQALEKI